MLSKLLPCPVLTNQNQRGCHSWPNLFLGSQAQHRGHLGRRATTTDATNFRTSWAVLWVNARVSWELTREPLHFRLVSTPLPPHWASGKDSLPPSQAAVAGNEPQQRSLTNDLSDRLNKLVKISCKIDFLGPIPSSLASMFHYYP